MAVAEALGMGRKKAQPGGNEKVARVPIASFKGTVAFLEWVRRLIAFTRLPMSTLIEHALVEFARSRGFSEPPPER